MAISSLWSSLGASRSVTGSASRCQPSRHWAIRSRRAFSAHGLQWSSRVDPQGTGTMSMRPVVVSMRRIASGRMQTPCCSASAWATSALSGRVARCARVIGVVSMGVVVAIRRLPPQRWLRAQRG